MANKKVVSNVESFNVEIADNGFMISYYGHAEDGEYIQEKMICKGTPELFSEIEILMGKTHG
jgi:hypothetical protein